MISGTKAAARLVDALSADWSRARFIGRMDFGAGPSPVLCESGDVFDMSQRHPTIASLVEAGDFDASQGVRVGPLEDLTFEGKQGAPKILSPIDFQCVKAAGVTFAVSALERVIEEQARGDYAQAARIRGRLEGALGGSIRSVVPGSKEADQLKQVLIDDGLWSQYLEVAIGPDAEIFTKAPVLATVGAHAPIGVRSDSTWNNPEPEIVLVANSEGRAIGATLGNDVNLRDFEGRSALLLSKAKDNNASCALGPLIRLFDDDFGMDDVRRAEVSLRIDGPEGYVLKGTSSMSEISRDPETLLAQALSEHHYPDGFVLFLGTLFAPTQDRDEEGRGFTHKLGDVVTISSPRIGTLVNIVTTSADAPAWTMGIGTLVRNLAARGILRS